MWQWNEADIYEDGSSRGLRGGGWATAHACLSSPADSYAPTGEINAIGFRVASVPEPGSLIITVMITVSGLLYCWRKHV